MSEWIISVGVNSWLRMNVWMNCWCTSEWMVIVGVNWWIIYVTEEWMNGGIADVLVNDRIDKWMGGGMIDAWMN